MCTLFWFWRVFIYGFTTSRRCGLYCSLNASFGNAFRLNNVGFDEPPMVYTIGLVIIQGIEYFIKWLVSIRQWCGVVDGGVYWVRLSQGVRRSHQKPLIKFSQYQNWGSRYKGYTLTHWSNLQKIETLRGWWRFLIRQLYSLIFNSNVEGFYLVQNPWCTDVIAKSPSQSVPPYIYGWC